MGRSRSALRTVGLCVITSCARKSITENTPFRKNISSSCAAVEWNTTSGIYGKDSSAPAGACDAALPTPGLRPELLSGWPSEPKATQTCILKAVIDPLLPSTIFAKSRILPS